MHTESIFIKVKAHKLNKLITLLKLFYESKYLKNNRVKFDIVIKDILVKDIF